VSFVTELDDDLFRFINQVVSDYGTTYLLGIVLLAGLQAIAKAVLAAIRSGTEYAVFSSIQRRRKERSAALAASLRNASRESASPSPVNGELTAA
jgi:hypothetical protein